MLTLSQRKTLKFINDFMNAHGHAPTASEIAAGIGIKSRGVVHRYLKALEASGNIELTPNRHRNIRVLNPYVASNQSQLPLVGQIAAGRPIEAISDHECIDVANIFLGENRYALRVKGDSMIEEGIFDGDIVVCEHSDTAKDGQIVVALIDHQEVTLKRFKHYVDNQVLLIPANERLQPLKILASRVTIQGIYVGLLRFV